MRRVYLAELRDAWPAWLGVAVAFMVTNLALALSALLVVSGIRLLGSGMVAAEDSAGVVWAPAVNLVACAVVGALVIGSATGLVVDSRRGSLARLALAGATPRQTTVSVLGQLVVVSLVCSVLADLGAAAALLPAQRFLDAEYDAPLPGPTTSYAWWPALAANVLAAGVAVLGGARQAARASRISAVEALRAASGAQVERMTVGRWVVAGLCAAGLVAGFAAIPGLTARRTSETVSQLLQASLALLLLTAVLLSRVAPVLVGPLTRAWTRLVPPIDPVWDLVRRTTVARGARLAKSVVPVMLVIGILVGMLALTDTLLSSARASGLELQVEATGPGVFVGLLGLPMLVALSGSVGSLVMMARQRDAELALSGIVGTTPGQRLAMPVLEAGIITGTGTVLGLVMVVVSIGYLAIAFPRVPLVFALSPAWPVLVGSLAVTLLITVSATVLPTLDSLRRPEPAVIARLVAE